MASLAAEIADLLGDDGSRAPRPTVREALRGCPRGELRPARAGAADVAVGRLSDGRPLVLDDRCPHDGGPLSDGWLEGDRVVCARHQWEFDAGTGRCLGRRDVSVRVIRTAGEASALDR